MGSLPPLALTPPGMPGTHPPIFWLGDVNGNIPQYYYVLSDIADTYWLPSVRSASSRFHSAIRRHQFASVPSHTPPHSVVRPHNLELALTPLFAADRLPNDPCWSAILIHHTDWVNTGWLSTSTRKDDMANISIPLADPRLWHLGIRAYLDKHCVHWSYNDVQLQSVVSRFCGHYCVLYCILRSRGIDMCSMFYSWHWF